MTIGTIAGGLALLNQGGIGGIVGGGMNTANAGTPCMVTEREFYCTELNNRDREFANYNSLNEKICQLAQRVSVDETAIAYQNKLVDKEFACVDKQMGWDRLATTYQIEAATCNVVRGKPMLSPSQLADPYVGTRLVLGSRQVPYCGGGYDNGCGGGYDNGCGCNGYGF